jgi:hypothetical protein
MRPEHAISRVGRGVSLPAGRATSGAKRRGRATREVRGARYAVQNTSQQSCGRVASEREGVLRAWGSASIYGQVRVVAGSPPCRSLTMAQEEHAIARNVLGRQNLPLLNKRPESMDEIKTVQVDRKPQSFLFEISILLLRMHASQCSAHVIQGGPCQATLAPCSSMGKLRSSVVQGPSRASTSTYI